MNLRDPPAEVVFRADARAWIEANLPEELRGNARSEEPLRDWRCATPATSTSKPFSKNPKH